MIKVKAIIPKEELDNFFAETGQHLPSTLDIHYSNFEDDIYSLYLIEGKRIISNTIVSSKNNYITKESLEEMERIKNG